LVTLRKERRLRVFENRVLGRIFQPKRDELTGEWRKPHNVELIVPYCSSNIVREIKSRRMRWAGHVARMGERGAVQCFSGGHLKERDHLEDLGVDGRILRIFNKCFGSHGLDCSGSG
jgi:hypothetical protein